ncbi:unnamed protein product [Onchocerca flexuosa]|uniref:Uncharacterized protein n=1 Tax=Onchocerca flexuosa TaxID=387005 RepID=A0A183HPF3_9BILA|nr:unnamed protein product [Onchocerca flexuosa]
MVLVVGGWYYRKLGERKDQVEKKEETMVDVDVQV